MTAAIQTFRLQQEILRILRLAGPSTTRDLCGVCARWMLQVPYTKLQGLLTSMRRVQAVTVYPIGRNEVLWALPGQPRPHRPRPSHPRVARVIPTSGQLVRESWWVQPNREAFQQAASRRWSES